MIFNSTNLVILLFVLFICYIIWMPFIKGKTIEAVVDAIEHPQDEDEKDKSFLWCYKFMYREQKAGKRYFCYSKTTFDSKEKMSQYPKGTQVKIRVYKDYNQNMKAVILEDKNDLIRALKMTVLTIGGGLLVACGCYFLNTKTM